MHDTLRSSPASAPTPTPLPIFVIAVLASYVAAQLLSNVASLKIATVGRWAVDMGSFLYPLTFTLRDMLHRQLGKRAAQGTIVVSACISVASSVYLMWATSLPSDAGWAQSGPAGLDLGLAFDTLLGPVWRIVAASVLAMVLSELLDTEVYHQFAERFGLRHLWGRVVFSNAISIPVDTALFCLIAFAGTMPWAVVLDIFWVNIALKFVISGLSVPLIYLGAQTKTAAQ